MRKIRIAQIGANQWSHAPDVFITMKSMPELFDIAGYALVEDERETCAYRRTAAAFEGYPELTLEEILNDPTIEAVAVETDEIHLLKYAQMAAEHGKHIHMEKPGSPSIADFERLIGTVREGGKVFHLGYMYRYNPYISDAIRRAQSGELGEIFAVEAHMSRLDGEVCRRWLSAFPGGMMFYLGCHLVDLVLQIRGMPTKIIPYNRAIDAAGIGTEDYAMAVLDYPNGVSFVRTSGAEIGGGNRRQLVITGTKGTIEIRPLEAGVKGGHFLQSATRAVTMLPDKRRVTETSEPFERYGAMLEAFAAMVRGERENPYTLDYETALFKAVMQCCGAGE